MKKNTNSIIIIAVSAIVVIGLLVWGIKFSKPSNPKEPSDYDGIDCKLDKTLEVGDKYSDDTYDYEYIQVEIDGGGYKGWHVKLKDLESTEPVKKPLCRTINKAPIISTFRMYTGSNTTKIDITGFDTSSVLDMSEMFSETNATEIVGLSQLDTSNAMLMRAMFAKTKLKEIDLLGFSTSNVLDMNAMFFETKAQKINVIGFDTRKVRDMDFMFAKTTFDSVDLSSFDITNVENIKNMFYESTAKTYFVGDNLELWEYKLGESE